MKIWLEKKLKSYGINNMLGFNVSAYAFLCICAVFGIFIFIFLTVLDIGSIFTRMVMFLIGFVSPYLMLMLSNSSDNDNMLVDIKNTFEMLKIQAHAGVYVVDALENSSLRIKSKRLKDAMEKLLAQIYMSQDLNEALDEFNESFSNKYIDTLVIIIKQSMESGYSVDQLEGAFDQMVDVEHAICIKKENETERNSQILQVMVMAGIIAMAVFCSVVEFKGIFEIL